MSLTLELGTTCKNGSMIAVTPLMSFTCHRPKPRAVMSDLSDRLFHELLTGSMVPGIKSSTKGVVPKMAPVSITIGVRSIEVEYAAS